MKKLLYVLFAFAVLFSMTFSLVQADSGASTLSITVLNQDPDPVVAGDVVELRISIENLGADDVSNLMLKMSDSYPFSLIDSADNLRSLGFIGGFQEGEDAKIVKYEFKVNSQAVAGTYNLDLSYYDASNPGQVTTRKLPVEVKNLESAEVSTISKSIFSPGEKDSLVFTIKNVGSAPLKDLFFSFAADDNVLLPVESGSTKYIKELGVGESTNVSYSVVADSAADVGLYELELSLEFKNALTGSSQTLTTTSGVYVGGETDFILAFSQVQSGEYSFTIANVGMTSAGAVTVSVPKQDGWSVSGADTSMIGNLNTGDYTLASFSLSSTKPGSPLNLIISYTDTMGVRHDTVESLSLSSQSSGSVSGDIPQFSGAGKGSGAMQTPGTTSTSSSNNTWLYVVIAVVVLFFVGRFIRKKYVLRKTSHHTKRM